MGIPNQSKQTRKGVLCVALALLLLLASGCGRSEIESTILTAAPAVIEESVTTIPATNEATEATTSPTTVPVTEPATAPESEPENEATTSPTTEPPTEPTSGQARDYVLNTNSKKFHYPDCGSVKQIKESNRSDYHGTREELIARGYSPCGRCKP